MKLQTTIEITAPSQLISLRNRIAFIGSCFAQHIGERMRQSGLPALVNPFGVLYNPLSILQVLTQNPMYEPLYFEDEDHRWHCWLTDSSKNASTLEACKAGLLSARGRLFEWNPDVVIITLGTNRYYEREGMVVGNCHKRPQGEFQEKDLSVEQMTTILESICQLFPKAQVVLTVSPYRYAKYGFHQSRLAKAALLLAVEAVQQKRPEQVSYFPAYEIQLDELRDYRFYAQDMLHPSEQAIEYIWERFVDRFFDAETHRYLSDYEPIRKAFLHRPEDPNSPATLRFHEQTQQRLSELLTKYNIEL
ncbi:MAG: GSCFA domain-containing protein [Bacteroidaceae bacterium]|nr:GSCFA domain-containing protein [Bacteroidaceae bacterium]MBQ9191058.1 GSCFA domain-containing protein [Bacteroidaceae bacterium]